MLPNCTTHRLERLSPSWCKRYTVTLSLSLKDSHTHSTLVRALTGDCPEEGSRTPAERSAVLFHSTEWGVTCQERKCLSETVLFVVFMEQDDTFWIILSFHISLSFSSTSSTSSTSTKPAERDAWAWKHSIHLLRRAHNMQSVPGQCLGYSPPVLLWEAPCFSSCPSVTTFWTVALPTVVCNVVLVKSIKVLWCCDSSCSVTHVCKRQQIQCGAWGCVFGFSYLMEKDKF